MWKLFQFAIFFGVAARLCLCVSVCSSCPSKLKRTGEKNALSGEIPSHKLAYLFMQRCRVSMDFLRFHIVYFALRQAEMDALLRQTYTMSSKPQHRHHSIRHRKPFFFDFILFLPLKDYLCRFSCFMWRKRVLFVETLRQLCTRRTDTHTHTRHRQPKIHI